MSVSVLKRVIDDHALSDVLSTLIIESSLRLIESKLSDFKIKSATTNC